MKNEVNNNLIKIILIKIIRNFRYKSWKYVIINNKLQILKDLVKIKNINE